MKLFWLTRKLLTVVKTKDVPPFKILHVEKYKPSMRPEIILLFLILTLVFRNALPIVTMFFIALYETLFGVISYLYHRWLFSTDHELVVHLEEVPQISVTLMDTAPLFVVSSKGFIAIARDKTDATLLRISL